MDDFQGAQLTAAVIGWGACGPRGNTPMDTRVPFVCVCVCEWASMSGRRATRASRATAPTALAKQKTDVPFAVHAAGAGGLDIRPGDAGGVVGAPRGVDGVAELPCGARPTRVVVAAGASGSTPLAGRALGVESAGGCARRGRKAPGGAVIARAPVSVPLVLALRAAVARGPVLVSLALARQAVVAPAVTARAGRRGDVTPGDAVVPASARCVLVVALVLELAAAARVARAESPGPRPLRRVPLALAALLPNPERAATRGKYSLEPLDRHFLAWPGTRVFVVTFFDRPRGRGRVAEGGAARGAGEQGQRGGHHDVLHGFAGCFFLR